MTLRHKGRLRIYHGLVFGKTRRVQRLTHSLRASFRNRIFVGVKFELRDAEVPTQHTETDVSSESAHSSSLEQGGPAGDPTPLSIRP